MRNNPLAALAVALSAAALQAQTIVPLVRQGDVIPGVGTVVDVSLVTLNANYDWIVEVQTDNPDPDKDRVALRMGYPFLKEGDPLAQPPGAVIKALDSYAYDWNGKLATNYTLGGAVGPNDFEGLYYDGLLLAQRGAPAVSSGFSPGTTWGNFADVQLHHEQMGVYSLLVRGYVDDPAIPGTSDFYAALLFADTAGSLLSTTVIAKEGQIPPGQTDAINTIRTGSWSGRVDSGFPAPLTTQVFWACDLNGSDLKDACVYRWSQSTGSSTLVAQEGSPSPVSGRNWGDLISPEIDVNTAGDWTLKDRLDGSSASDGIIVKNGAKFVQEGDGHPAIAPFVFNELGNGPAKLTADGRILWFGGWNDSAPGAYREALFLDQKMLVREGQTQVNGVLLQDIEQENDSYTITADGQSVIFIGTLAGGVEGAFLLSLDGVTSYCTAKLNSQGCVPYISWYGVPSASAPSGFKIWGKGVISNQIGLFFYGTSGPSSAPFSGGLLCVQPPIKRLPAASSGGSGGCSGLYGLDFNTYVAQGGDPQLVAGAQVNGQFWSRDTGLPPPFPTGLTGGIQFVLGP